MRTLAQDLKYSLRVHAKSPAFTAIIVLTLALAIGASTAVFSVVNAILIKPLPYPHADRLAMLWRVYPGLDGISTLDFPWAVREIRAFFDHPPRSFEQAGAFKSDSFNLTGHGEPVRLDGIRASAGFFPAVGVAPLLGRAFTTEENEPGREHEVILSYSLWVDRFGADPDVLGRAAELNGAAYTIVGVMPAGFAFPRGDEMPGLIDLPREAHLWVPMPIPANVGGPSEHGMVARLKPGVDFKQAAAEVQVTDKYILSAIPSEKGDYSRVKALAQQATGDSRRPLLLLLCAVGVVLLIACSNVASLLLTRSLARRREFALRGALGAGRARMMRQLLTETVLLAAFAGVAGVALAQMGIHFLKLLAAPVVPRLAETGLDLTVLAFSAGITVITGILIGIAPALGPAKESLVAAIREGDQRSGASAGTSMMRSALLVSQVALALVLTISAGLLVRTFYRMLSADAGFKSERILTFQLSLPVSKYPDIAAMTRLYTRAIDKIRSLPQVESAGLVSAVPFGGEPDSSVLRIPGLTDVNREQPYANWTFASPDYFSTVGTRLLRGRDFLETDTLDAPPVTIINATMAKKYWPGQDALGKQASVQNPTWPLKTVVGIVADEKRASLREEPSPEMYVPYTQNAREIWPPMRNLQVALRTKDDPVSAIASLRSAMHAIDPDLPLAKVSTLGSLVDNSMSTPRFSMLLVASFGLLAVLLACVGMYGTISYSVAQRRREIATRIVLGAERSTIFAMILGQGTRVAGLGIAIGIIAALGATRLLAGFLYGVEAADPLTFAGVSILLAAVALLACYVPARRAMAVDPADALRHE